MAKGIMYVDNIRVEFDDEPTIMDVCRKAGVEMPNFCFHSDLSVYGACRMCMVEDLDTGKIDAACTTKPKNGMRIRTNTSRLLKYRRMILELMLASHCRDCTACEKNRSCRLQEMAVRFGIHHVHFKDTREHVPMDFSSPAVTFDLNKCILCGDCVRVCEEMQGMGILNFAYRFAGGQAPRRLRGLRPVRRRVHDRRHHRQKRHRRGVASPARPAKARRHPDRARRARRHR